MSSPSRRATIVCAVTIAGAFAASWSAHPPSQVWIDVAPGRDQRVVRYWPRTGFVLMSTGSVAREMIDKVAGTGYSHRLYLRAKDVPERDGRALFTLHDNALRRDTPGSSD